MRNSVTVSVTGSFFQVQVWRSGSMRKSPRSSTFAASVSFGALPSFGVERRKMALTCSTRRDGASALDGFKTSPPGLAILDIKMPRMDGMETLRRLRQKSDLPVIFLTSKDEEIDELFGLKMGADDFIRKPFSQRLLVERVKAVLRRAAPKDPTAVPKET